MGKVNFLKFTHGSYYLMIAICALLTFTASGFAANVTSGGEHAGQGNTITAGYTSGPVTYFGSWNGGGNNTNTNVTKFSFVLKLASDGVGPSTATNSNTAVWAQLLVDGGAANWAECGVAASPVPGTVLCTLSGPQQKPLAQVTGVNIVARDRNEDPVPPDMFTPADLSPLLWLDASDVGTVSSTEAGLVYQWRDKSGNGRIFSQSTEGAMPDITSATQNGLPVMRFDGSDYMVGTGFSISQASTYIFAYRAAETAGYYVFDGTPSSGRNAFGRGLNGTGQIGAFAGSGGISLNINHPLQDVFAVVFNGASSQLYRNGQLIASGNIGTQSASNGLTLGARFSLSDVINGELYEIIVVSGALTQQTIQTTTTYLNNKWGLNTP